MRALLSSVAPITFSKKKVPFFSGTNYSPTAESFGVSAQIGSGVVRGVPEVRIPRGFHQSKVPPGSARAAGWFEVRFREGSLRGLRGGPGWFEVRFHEGSTRVPPGSTRAAGWWFQVRFHEGPPGFHQVLRGLGWSGVV